MENIDELRRISTELFERKLIHKPIAIDDQLAELCLKSSKSTIDEFDSNENHIIVWLTTDCKQSIEIVADLQIQFFNTNDEFIDFISEIQTKNVFAIIDDNLAFDILPFLNDFSQIVSIFIKQTTNNLLSIDSQKPIHISSNDKNEIFDAIKENIEVYANDYISTNIFTAHIDEESTNETKNASFLWYHLLINSLFNLKHCQHSSKQELVNYCREQYKVNSAPQKTIDNFEKTYSSDNAIMWYTKESFLYHLFNHALRTRCIDSIFKFRFFLIDFQEQLEQNYDEEIFDRTKIVYRGQRFSPLEFEKLTKSKDAFIAINTYFSTTIDKQTAEVWAQGQFSVLFEINLSNVKSIKNKRARPVYVAHKSAIPDEKEVIFPIGSIFKIDQVNIDGNSCRILLSVANDDKYEELFNYLQNNIIQTLPSTVQFADLLISSGEYNKAEEFIPLLIQELETSDDNVSIGYAYSYQADILTERNHHQSALSWYDKALAHIPNGDIKCAKIYLQMSSVYRDSKDFKNASKYLQKASTYEQQMDSFIRIQLWNSYGRFYTDQNQFDQALDYFNKALNLCSDEHINNFHLPTIYFSLSLLHMKKSDYTQGIQLLRDALKESNSLIPKTHPHYTLIYFFIGLLYHQSHDYSNALIYCQKALQNDKHITPFQRILTCCLLVEISMNNNDIYKQIHYSTEAFHVYQKRNTTALPDSIKQTVFVNRSSSELIQHNFQSAMSLLVDSLECIHETEERLIIYGSMAGIYLCLDDKEKALDCLEKSSELHSLSSDRIVIADLNYCYSRFYAMQSDNVKFMEHVENALKLSEENRNYDHIYIYAVKLIELCPNKADHYIKKLSHILEHSNDLSLKNKEAYHTYLGIYFQQNRENLRALDHFQTLLILQKSKNPICYHDLICTNSLIVNTYRNMESNFANKIIEYGEECLFMYDQLSQMKNLPLQEKYLISFREGKLVDNLSESSLLTTKIFMIHCFLGDIFKNQRDSVRALDHFDHAEQLLADYQRQKPLSEPAELYFLLSSGYKNLSSYQKAIFYQKKAIESLPSNDHRLGSYYACLIHYYYKIKDFTSAIGIFPTALTCLSSSPVVDTSNLASILDLMSLICAELNSYELAFTYSEQALGYRLLSQPQDYNSIVFNYCAGANYLWKWKPWDPKQPLTFLLPALNINRRMLTNSKLENLYSLVGFFYERNNMYKQSLSYYEKSFIYLISTDDQIDYYRKIWMIYICMGNFRQALNIIYRSMNIQIGHEHMQICDTYMKMGWTIYRMGKYKLAYQCFITSFNCLRDGKIGKTHERYGEIYNYIALVYFKFGELHQALKYALKSRAILLLDKNKHALPILPCITLGLIECRLENYHRSLEHFGKAWELIYNNNCFYYLAYKTLYNHIGYVYFKLNQIDLAMKFYEKSLSLTQQHPDAAQIHKNIGLIYELNRETYSKAIDCYESALKCLRECKDHSDYKLCESLLTRLLSKMGKRRNKNKLCQLI